MKQYDDYQVVAQKWVDEIPEHWDFYRIKRIFAQRVEKNDPVITENILSLTAKQGVVPIAEKEGAGGNKPKGDMTQYNVARPDDLLVNCMNIVSGSAGVSRYFGAINPVYYALYPRLDCNVWYYHYLFRLMPFQRNLLGLGKGILMHESDSGKLNTVRMRISMDYLGNVPLPVPPRAEQDQIVRYLDWQVSIINRLIAAKRKQIGLLKEQERSVAVHYITHSCNPQAVMKDSGIDWVEMIPQHWDVLFLQQVAEERFVKNAGMLEDNLLSLSYGHIIRKDINTTDGLLPASFEGYQIVEKDDTVLRLTDLQNDQRSLRTGLVLERGIITSAYTCIKPRKNILPEYLQLQLHSADLCKVFYGLGGGVRQSIGYKDIRELLMFVPPLEEQQEILDAIKRESASSLPCYNKLEEEITVLQELRTRLISDVVTGQIDVRDVEIPDFEYISETDDNGEETDDEKSDDMAEEEV